MTRPTADHRATTPDWAPTGARRRQNLALLTVVAVFALAALGTAAASQRRREQEWRHGGDQVAVHATITATNPAGLGAVLADAGAPREPGVLGAAQMLVLRVRWHGTPGADGEYEFILLDNRVAPAQLIRAYGAWTARGRTVDSGWDSAYEALAKHYPWLAGTASRLTAAGWTGEPDAFGYPASQTGAGTLSYWLGRDALTTTRPARDLSLAMFYLDAGGEVRWAKKVPLTELG